MSDKFHFSGLYPAIFISSSTKVLCPSADESFNGLNMNSLLHYNFEILVFEYLELKKLKTYACKT